MLNRYAVVLIAVMVLSAVGMANAENLQERFQYLHPIPGSELVSKQTTIIMRTGDYVTTGDIGSYSRATITGSESGSHNFEVIISSDDKTAILKPYSEFSPGEVVTVSYGDGNSFTFTISPKTHPLLTEADWDEIYGEFYFNNSPEPKIIDGLTTDIDPSLPMDFPPVDVPVNTSPAPGYVFLSNHGLDYGTTPYLMILENNGTPIYFKKMERLINDFKLSRSNLITYCEFQRGFTFDNVFYAMDQSYTVVDSFRIGNGYITDQHAFKLLDNYHTLITAYDPQTWDMSDSIEGGDTAATVIGLIVQELDSLKNVIFQWRSWDHFSIMDAPNVNYLGGRIDYVHGNSIDLTLDSNIIISCRSMNELTKIDRSTGNIIWRLGKNAYNNDFTIIGDTAGFSAQHHARILANGNLTCYDNGNYHTPQFSRAVEYELDEDAMTCTQVWEYRDNPDIYGGNRGNAQRLPNGNTMIGWGGGAGVTATEVQMDGTKVYEINLGDPVVQTSYRAYRFPWTGIATQPYLIAEQDSSGIHLVFNQFGDLSITEYAIYADVAPNPTVPIDSTVENYYYMTGLPNGIIYYIRVTGIDYSGIEGGYSNEVEIAAPNLYMPGDANGDDQIIGSDVTFLVNYFRGLSTPPDSCWNPTTEDWLYSAADANGDCLVIGSDVTRLVNYFRGQSEIAWCEDTWPYGYEQ